MTQRQTARAGASNALSADELARVLEEMAFRASVNDYGNFQRKQTVGETRSLDALKLQKHRVFAKGGCWTLSSGEQEDGFSVQVWCESETYEKDGVHVPFALRLFYTARGGNGIEVSRAYRVPLDFTLLHFGSGRWWFRCPMILNGQRCARRCRFLYLPAGAVSWGCRECYQLTYESRQRHREFLWECADKPLTMLARAEARLQHKRSLHRRERLLRRMEWARDRIMLGLNHPNAFKAGMVGAKALEFLPEFRIE